MPAKTGATRGHLFCFGLGFSARALVSSLMSEGWAVAGTTRSESKRAELAASGIAAFVFDRGQPLDDAAAMLAAVTHLLVSVPPDDLGDPVLDAHAAAIAASDSLRWIGYLSTTGVYGDTNGAIVDETAALNPSAQRSIRRVEVERSWLELWQRHQRPVHVFRLAGIYGPGRSTIDQVRRGEARCIDRPGHVFSRIHVDDIAAVLRASIACPHPGRIYNVCDDEAAAPADVVAYACDLLGTAPPPLVPYEAMAERMSAMARSFWRDNRRVDNTRIKQELGVRLKHPTYRSGLAAIAAAALSPDVADDGPDARVAP